MFGKAEVLPAGEPYLGPNSYSAGIRFHKRAVVTGAAGTLDSFISGGVPLYRWDERHTAKAPFAVDLAVESASSATKVYVTYDGGTSPEVSATLGFEIPVTPAAPLHLAVQNLATSIRLFSAGTCNVQCYFYYE